MDATTADLLRAFQDALRSGDKAAQARIRRQLTKAAEARRETR